MRILRINPFRINKQVTDYEKLTETYLAPSLSLFIWVSLFVHDIKMYPIFFHIEEIKSDCISVDLDATVNTSFYV